MTEYITRSDDETPGTYEWLAKEKRKLVEAVVTMQNKIDEDARIIAALTAVTGNQHAEIVRSHARITELLKSNNEFEERARKAERRVKELEGLIDSEYLSHLNIS